MNHLGPHMELAATGGPELFQVETDVVASSLAALREQLRARLSAEPALLTLDFAAVEMVDSAGLGLLIATHNSMKSHGGRLAIIHCSDDVLELFVSLRLNQHFSVSGREERSA